jgi:putative membrane protein
MHDREVRFTARPARAARAIDPARARAGLARETLAVAAAALTALAALGLTGCGGGGNELRDEAPARSGASGGEVMTPGATASGPDSQLPGTAGSGTAAAGDGSGSIGTPGQGTLQSGDPSDAGVRSLIDAINTAETEASTLALQKAQHAEVKRYAQAMIAAHRQAPLDKGVAAAGTNSANDLLLMLTDAHQKTMQQLQSTANGPAFDRAYINAQVQAHEGALQSLERAETAAADASLIDRVRRMQTTVEGHLAEARRVQALLPTQGGRATPGTKGGNR